MRGSVFLNGGALALSIAAAAPLAAQTPAGEPRLQAAPGIRVDAAYLVGAWSDREDCGAAIQFRANGQFTNPDGSGGTWRLDGDRLSLTGTRTVTVRMVPRSRNETIVVQANGALGYSQRCPAQPAR